MIVETFAVGFKFSNDVNCEIFPDPLTNNPVAVLSFVQKNAVPAAFRGLTKVVVGTVPSEQTTIFVGSVRSGTGLTVTIT